MLNKLKQTLKYFYSFVWKEKPVYIIWLFISIVFNALLPFIDIILPKYLIDEMIGNKRISILLLISVAIISGNYLFNVIIHISKSQLQKYDDWFERYFKMEIALRTMNMDFYLTEDPKSLNQLRKALDGMGWYSGGLKGLSTCIQQCLSNIIMLIGVSTIIACSSPVLLVIAFLTVAASSWIVSKINMLEIKMFQKGPKMNRKFWYIADTLTDSKFAKSIRLYHANTMIQKYASDNIDEIYRLFYETAIGHARWNGVNAVILFLKNAGMYIYLGLKLIRTKIGIGDFSMLSNAVNTLTNSLQGIISQLQEIQKKITFMYEYKKFMEYDSTKKTGRRKILENQDVKIEFKHVYFRYPNIERYILKDINIVIRPGEHLSLVGVNGAGKTTFIKLLCRLYDVSSGEILLNGVNINEINYEQYIGMLAVVFQDYKLFPLTLEENIRLSDRNSDSRNIIRICEKCGLKDRVDSLADGLQTPIYKYFSAGGIEPSGGEGQKIAIARAIYKNAPLVILDEPTAALDPLAEYEVYKNFDLMVGKKTSIYISHRLAACKFSDRIAVFADSTIKEYGTHEELINNKEGIYATMFEKQACYYV